MGIAIYSNEFKRDAVHKFTVPEYPLSEVSKLLGEYVQNSRRREAGRIRLHQNVFATKHKHAGNGMLSPV